MSENPYEPPRGTHISEQPERSTSSLVLPAGSYDISYKGNWGNQTLPEKLKLEDACTIIFHAGIAFLQNQPHIAEQIPWPKKGTSECATGNMNANGSALNISFFYSTSEKSTEGLCYKAPMEMSIHIPHAAQWQEFASDTNRQTPTEKPTTIARSMRNSLDQLWRKIRGK